MARCRRRVTIIVALALMGAAVAGCVTRSDPPAASASPGYGDDAARGESKQSRPPATAQPDTGQRLLQIYVFRDGALLTVPSEALSESRLVHDVRDLMWVADRGGAGIAAEDSQLLPSSALPLASQQRQDGFTHLWVRFEFSPAERPAEGQESGHGDVMLYVDHENPADAWLAVQDVADPQLWLMTPLPGYGLWLEREVDLFLRLSMGL